MGEVSLNVKKGNLFKDCLFFTLIDIDFCDTCPCHAGGKSQLMNQQSQKSFYDNKNKNQLIF